MIPISDKVFLLTNKKPLAVWFLIGINIALFLWEIKLEMNGELATFFNSWGLVPERLSRAFGSAISGNPAALLIVFCSSLSIFSAMFLHASYSQIIGNLIFLWVFGNTLEKIIGSGRFLLFYLFCGFLTGIVQIIAEPNLAIPLIGANGAIVPGFEVHNFWWALIFSLLLSLINTLLTDLSKDRQK